MKQLEYLDKLESEEAAARSKRRDPKGGAYMPSEDTHGQGRHDRRPGVPRQQQPEQYRVKRAEEPSQRGGIPSVRMGASYGSGQGIGSDATQRKVATHQQRRTAAGEGNDPDVRGRDSSIEGSKHVNALQDSLVTMGLGLGNNVTDGRKATSVASLSPRFHKFSPRSLDENHRPRSDAPMSPRAQHDEGRDKLSVSPIRRGGRAVSLQAAGKHQLSNVSIRPHVLQTVSNGDAPTQLAVESGKSHNMFERGTSSRVEPTSFSQHRRSRNTDHTRAEKPDSTVDTMEESVDEESSAVEHDDLHGQASRVPQGSGSSSGGAKSIRSKNLLKSVNKRYGVLTIDTCNILTCSCALCIKYFVIFSPGIEILWILTLKGMNTIPTNPYQECCTEMGECTYWRICRAARRRMDPILSPFQPSPIAFQYLLRAKRLDQIFRPS